jgi:hypothetical protein
MASGGYAAAVVATDQENRGRHAGVDPGSLAQNRVGRLSWHCAESWSSGVGEVMVGVFEADLAQVLHWGEADVAAEPFLQRTETAAGDLCEAGEGEWVSG